MRIDERTVAHATRIEELMRHEVEGVFASRAARARRKLQSGTGIHKTRRTSVHTTGKVAPCRIRAYKSQAACHILHLAFELVADALCHGKDATRLVAVALIAP